MSPDPDSHRPRPALADPAVSSDFACSRKGIRSNMANFDFMRQIQFRIMEVDSPYLLSFWLCCPLLASSTSPLNTDGLRVAAAMFWSFVELGPLPPFLDDFGCLSPPWFSRENSSSCCLFFILSSRDLGTFLIPKTLLKEK